jgi:hypothetical protein
MYQVRWGRTEEDDFIYIGTSTSPAAHEEALKILHIVKGCSDPCFVWLLNVETNEITMKQMREGNYFNGFTPWRDVKPSYSYSSKPTLEI